MTIGGKRLTAIAILLGCAATTADAQSVIMRKPLAGATFGEGTGAPAPVTTPTPTATGSWITSAPRPLAPSCSQTAPATRDVWCQGTDGARLPDASCSADGPRPSTTTTVADTSGCGYAWQPVGGTTWSSTCSDTAEATRHYACQRQDGATVPASACDTSHRETETETAANLTDCAYEISQWRAVSYSSTCSASATRTWEASGCRRSGGGETPTAVPLSACEAAGIAMTKTDTVANYDGCGYTPTYSTTYGACAGGQQSAPMVSCRRSDGKDVPIDDCWQYRATTTRTCTVPACPTVTRYNYFRDGAPSPSMRVSSPEAAAEYCNSIARTGQKGVCVWSSGSASSGPAYFVEGGSIDPTINGNLWASTCG